jgi:hypothetical protein
MGRAVQVTFAGTFVLICALAEGCGTTEQTALSRTAEPAETDLRTAEKDFRPSDYGREAAKKRPGEDAQTREDKTGTDTASVAATPGEMVQGFRVQVFSSGDIDIAKARMTEAEGMFPGDWFYISYDAPVYKIRAGNFLNRLDAERFMQSAQERGFRGAWVVPEKVIKDPPPPPPRETLQTPK